MKANIEAVNFTATENLIEFIDKKIDKLVHKFGAINSIDVTMNVERALPIKNKGVSIKVALNKSPLIIHHTENTFEEAIDKCIAGLERMLEKNKGK